MGFRLICKTQRFAITRTGNLNDTRREKTYVTSRTRRIVRDFTAPGLRVGLTDRSRTSVISGISSLSVSVRRCSALSARSRTGAMRSRTNTTVWRTRTPNRRALRPCWFLEITRASSGHRRTASVYRHTYRENLTRRTPPGPQNAVCRSIFDRPISVRTAASCSCVGFSLFSGTARPTL